MANYATLKAEVQADIYQNSERAITGQVLQDNLIQIINSLASYKYLGILTPGNLPEGQDFNMFYFAITEGSYGTFSVVEGELAIFTYNGSWSKVTLFTKADKINTSAISTSINAQSTNAQVASALAAWNATKNAIKDPWTLAIWEKAVYALNDEPQEGYEWDDEHILTQSEAELINESIVFDNGLWRTDDEFYVREKIDAYWPNKTYAIDRCWVFKDMIAGYDGYYALIEEAPIFDYRLICIEWV